MHLFTCWMRADLIPLPNHSRRVIGPDIGGQAYASFEGARIGPWLEYDATSPARGGTGNPELYSDGTGPRLNAGRATSPARPRHL